MHEHIVFEQIYHANVVFGHKCFSCHVMRHQRLGCFKGPMYTSQTLSCESKYDKWPWCCAPFLCMCTYITACIGKHNQWHHWAEQATGALQKNQIQTTQLHVEYIHGMYTAQSLHTCIERTRACTHSQSTRQEARNIIDNTDSSQKVSIACMICYILAAYFHRPITNSGFALSRPQTLPIDTML